MKKRRQLFGEKTGEHAFMSAYRVVKGEHKYKYQVGKLLQDICAITQLSDLAQVGRMLLSFASGTEEA